MKKTISLILLLAIISLFLTFSSCLAQIPAGCKSIQYEVVIERIDSTNDYMIICASNSERKFKIVTRKVENDCRNVSVGDSFNLSLCSLNSMDPYNSMPCDWNYGWPGDNNVIPNEVEYDCDIFLTDDIYGLCFTDDTQRKKEYQRYIQEHPLNVKVKGERAFMSDTISDSIVLSKKMSRVELSYWNIFTKECDEYLFSYTQNPRKLILKSNCPVDSAPIMEIKSDSAISLFVNSINRFYILKTDKIVIKKTKKNEEIESDFETLHIDLYTIKGERIFESTEIESGYYELIFNPDYELFVNLLNELILQYDSLF